jgi:hypothetical protein
MSGYSSPLRGSRKSYSLVTQGSQSLALGLTNTAASQLVAAPSDVSGDQEHFYRPVLRLFGESKRYPKNTSATR